MIFRLPLKALPLKNRLKQVVERTDTAAGRAFDLLIQALIILSLVSFSLDTLPDLPVYMREALRAIELVIVLVFSVEYILRIVVAEQRLRFIFSFNGLVDLLAILPFYLTVGVDLRSIRVIRLFRLFRLFKIFRYTETIERLRRALGLIQNELAIYLVATAVLLYLASVGIYHFESQAQPEVFASVFHSLWWALVTLTTVGYGDVYPVTVGGRIFTGLLMLIGVGVVAVPSGLVASALTQSLAQEKRRQDEP
jgi:voltage-gated potassium channel